ncbi:hypothetical protein [Roseibium aggregatum]|uniref:Secreted protein n=1 Tax=Roseibium aggregatum TaxID=187304 RepID=A0A926S8I1_9HYPH|nr:hypothetical protein [Roseibium aggregatum]MBD1549565.1 hypothetical protein [Roseibium aggregatum]
MTNKSLKLSAAVITVALGMTLSVTASLIADEASSGDDAVQAAAETSVVTNRQAKADLSADLDDVKPMDVRCVSQARTTTCTGWPVAQGFQISGL